MLLEKEIFDKLCPSYQKAVEKLDEKYAAILEEDNYVAKLEIFKEFFYTYLMPPQLWDKFFNICNDYDDWILQPYSIEKFYFLQEVRRECRYNYKISYYQFYDNQSPFCKARTLIHKKPNLMGFPENPYTLKEMEAQFICPQTHMDNTFKYYDEHSGSPITKQLLQKFQNAKKNYEEILKFENDQITWFNLLIQCENVDFVCDNIDIRLGKDLNNLELWKLYFDYIKRTQNTKRLLHLYSRYCRYFLDDLEMKEEYKEATKKYGPVKVFWKNTFDFEIPDESPDFFLLSDRNKPESKNIVKASFESYEKQIFSFPKTIMFYIITNGSPNILHNLHKTCKYFFVFRPYPVCHRLWYSMIGNNGGTFFGQSLTVCTDHEFNEANLIFEHKVIISNCFHVHRKIYLSKIYQCNAKYIQFSGIDISFKELIFLIGHGNVETLIFHALKILNGDNSFVALEEILKLLPKITVFEIKRTRYPITTLKTFDILPTLHFEKKFKLFNLDLFSYLEPYGFCEFLKKNLDFNSICHTELKKDFENTTELKEIMEKELKNYWPEHLKPDYYIYLQAHYY